MSRGWRATGLAFVFLLVCVAAACSTSESASAAGRHPPDSAPPTDTIASRDTQRATATPRRHVLFIGTSLTAGLGLEPDSAYPMLVQYKIDSAGLPFEVTNAGVSGETSAALLQRLDWLMRGDFDVVVLETGANDGLRGIPVPSMRRNIEDAVVRIQRAHPKARVLLAQMEAPPNMGAAYTSQFHAVYPDVARQTGVALMPFLLDGVAGRRELNQGDGIHPNTRGSQIVAANVWRALAPLLGGSGGR